MSRVTLAGIPRGLRIAVARQTAGRIMPYFSTGIAAMGFCEVPGLGTTAVTKDGLLLADLDSLGKETALEAATGLIHEFMHVFLRHQQRFDAFSKARGWTAAVSMQKRALWNQAADLEINDGLVASGCPQECGGEGDKILLPKDFEFPDNLLAEQYFDLLEQRNKEAPSKPQAGCGWCGSGAGHAVPGEPEPDPQQGRLVELTRSDVDQAVISASEGRRRGAFSPPDCVVRDVHTRVRSTNLRWDQLLARAARGCIQIRAGVDDYSYAIRNRQAGAFRSHGRKPILPGMVQRLAEVALLVDTSGSMGEQEHARILANAEEVLRALAGARLTVVAIDTEVRSQGRVARARDIAQHLKGGGGTHLSPAMRRLDSARPRPDVVIVATDGYIEDRLYVPPGIQVIGLIMPGGDELPGVKNVMVE